MKLVKLLAVVGVLSATVVAAAVNAKSSADVYVSIKADGLAVVTVDNPTWLPKTMTAQLYRNDTLLDTRTVRAKPFSEALVVLRPGLLPEQFQLTEINVDVWEQ